MRAANQSQYLQALQLPLTDFQQKCVDGLRDNTRSVQVNDKIFTRTIPSPEFYVHLWNWDSATVAMGLMTVDLNRALQELMSLTSAQ